MTIPHLYDAVIIGAGMAGLAAASALSRSNASVALIDRKPFVGGRAYSYLHPAIDEVVDSQHVLVGCCTNLRHLCETAGIADRIRWYDTYTFLEPGGRRSTLTPTALPSPGHSSLSFLQAPMLSLADKAAIARGLLPFLHGYPDSDRESVAQWLKRTRQPERAIRHFWEPIIIGALNDTFDRCSMKYAGQVFHETFLKSAEGGRLGIPTLPLSDFYHAVADDAQHHGTHMHLKTGVRSLVQKGPTWHVTLENGSILQTRCVITSLSFEHLQSVLSADLLAQLLPRGTAPFQHSPITTIHLWYDRQITDLDHAVLLDTGIQWLFHKSRIRKWPSERGSYLELTISASHAQLKQSREQILSTALRELTSFFPEAQRATLRKSGVLKEAKATFSVTPGLDTARPAQRTSLPGLYLAGDWTQTGWPSTMEGAVRSGYLAAEAVSADLGAAERFLQLDLPATGLMRFFINRPNSHVVANTAIQVSARATLPQHTHTPPPAIAAGSHPHAETTSPQPPHSQT